MLLVLYLQMFVGPVLLFLSLFLKATISQTHWDGDMSSQIIGVVNIFSSIGCIYATSALLHASKGLLNEYQIAGKFKMIQLGIIILKYPPALLALFGTNTAIDDVYTTSVMNTAYTAIICLVLYPLLSFGFRKHFDITTARNAMRNAQSSSYTASLGSKTEIIDLVEHHSSVAGYVHFEEDNNKSLGPCNVGDAYVQFDTPKSDDSENNMAADYVAPASNGVGDDSQQRLL